MQGLGITETWLCANHVGSQILTQDVHLIRGGLREGMGDDGRQQRRILMGLSSSLACLVDSAIYDLEVLPEGHHFEAVRMLGTMFTRAARGFE